MEYFLQHINSSKFQIENVFEANIEENRNAQTEKKYSSSMEQCKFIYKYII